MQFEKSKGDPCCYVKNVEGRPIICLSWVDNCLCMGTITDFIAAKTKLMEYFECDGIGYCKDAEYTTMVSQ